MHFLSGVDSPHQKCGRTPIGRRFTGYGKPPVHTLFKKGQSFNPRGRPRGSKNNAILLKDALDQTVAITENGRRRHITKREAMFTQLANKAAQGTIAPCRPCCARARSSTAVAKRHLKNRNRSQDQRLSSYAQQSGSARSRAGSSARQSTVRAPGKQTTRAGSTTARV